MSSCAPNKAVMKGCGAPGVPEFGVISWEKPMIDHLQG